MKTAFLIPYDKKFKQILSSTHDEMLSLIKKRNPNKAEAAFPDDEEISMLHDCLAMIRLGYFKMRFCECGSEKDDGLILLEINQH